MRLTRIGRAASLGLAVLLGVGAAWSARDSIAALFSASAAQSQVEVRATKRSLVYRLDARRPLVFAFSRPATSFRVVSLPLVDEASWRSRDYWTYGFRAVLYGSDDTVVAVHDIYSRALHPDRILPFRRPVRFMRDTPARIALQDDVVVESAVPVSRVELSPLPSDGPVLGIDLRAYERLPYFGPAALAAFRRRSPAEQAELASASALPAELLPDAARAALMANRWRVIGPLGIPGEDYRVSVLYERGYAAPRAGKGEE